jgi:hypothetical protein
VLHLGVWRHGLSIHGRGEEAAAGFPARHPRLGTSKGAIRLRPAEAVEIPDTGFRDLFRAVLAPWMGHAERSVTVGRRRA